MEGTIKWFNEEKRYGFIASVDGDVFFHIKDCPADYEPREGDVVKFNTASTPKGPKAVKIKIV